MEAAESRGRQRPMVIGIIGWGSLCYEWGELSLVEPVRWRLRGPRLPIEFSRKSKTGRRAGLLTAVIDTSVVETQRTRVSTSRLHSVPAIRAELRLREGGRTASVDRYGNSRGECEASVFEAIASWLQTSDYDAVVWTAIPPDFGEERYSQDAAIQYFRSLGETDPVMQREARNYVAWAPDEVNTPLRRALSDARLLDDAGPRPINIGGVWTD